MRIIAAEEALSELRWIGGGMLRRRYVADSRRGVLSFLHAVAGDVNSLAAADEAACLQEMCGACQ